MEGDDHGEAYTAIVWGGLLSRESSNIAEAEAFSVSGSRGFALSLHPEKTRLIEFGRHAAANREKRGLGKPETFNFLGFTLLCSKSRRGNFLLKRKSRRDRTMAKLQEIKAELRRRMHTPIPEQGRWLQQVVTGFFG